MTQFLVLDIETLGEAHDIRDLDPAAILKLGARNQTQAAVLFDRAERSSHE